MAISVESWIAIVGVVMTIAAVFLAQWLASRKARHESRSEKLEQLILTLNEAWTFNEARHRTAREMALKPPPVTDDPLEYVRFSRDMPLERRISIYVKDHFPELEARDEDLHAKSRPMVEMFHRFSEGKPVRLSGVLAVWADVRSSLKTFEEEIRNNRSLLQDGTKGRYQRLPDTPPIYPPDFNHDASPSGEVEPPVTERRPKARKRARGAPESAPPV